MQPLTLLEYRESRAYPIVLRIMIKPTSARAIIMWFIGETPRRIPHPLPRKHSYSESLDEDWASYTANIATLVLCSLMYA